MKDSIQNKRSKPVQTDEKDEKPGMNRTLKISAQRITEYMMVIAVVLNCNSVYSAAEKDFHLNEIIAVLSLLLVVIGLIKTRINRQMVMKWLWLFIPYYFVVFLYAALGVPGSSLLGYASRFVIFVPFMSFYLGCLGQKGEQDRILGSFANIMVILSYISLFFWFFGSFLGILKPNVYIPAIWGSEFTYPGYFGLYFERQTISMFSFTGYRNAGIFTEGPMFSICLIVAIATLLFIRRPKGSGKLRHKEKRQLFVLSVALITTMSFAGYILAVVMFFVYYYMNSPNRKDTFLFKLITVASALVIGGIAVLALVGEKQGSTSWMIRLDDIQAGYKAWMLSPIIGNGYGSYAVEQFMSAFRWFNMGFSSALFSVLSQGGILFFSVYFLGFFLGIRTGRKRNRNLLVFTAVIIAEFIMTSFHFTFLLMLLLAYFYSVSMIGRTRQNDEYAALLQAL